MFTDSEVEEVDDSGSDYAPVQADFSSDSEPEVPVALKSISGLLEELVIKGVDQEQGAGPADPGSPIYDPPQIIDPTTPQKSVFEVSAEINYVKCTPNKKPTVIDAAVLVPESESDDDTGFPIHIPSSDESEDELDESEIVRDDTNPNIYIRKILRSDTNKRGQKKKTSRVYNLVHACPFCSKKVKNFSHHAYTHKLEKTMQEIKEMDDKIAKKQKMDCLRRKADHMHNMAVLQLGKGEIIIGRRPNNDKLHIYDYGPCAHCFEWLKITTIARHQKWCPAEGKKHETKGVLITQCSILAGRINHQASEQLVKEVFPRMVNDDIGRIAKTDPLIVTTGNLWLLKNMGNVLKRANYTSGLMRLNARLLNAMRERTGNKKMTVSDCLQPKYFDEMVNATLQCACLDMDDESELATPSNAIKLGFEIKRLVGAKKGYAIRTANRAMRDDCADFLELMESEWSVRVTKQARLLLIERAMHKRDNMPDPQDIENLTKYMVTEISKIDLSDQSTSNYRHIAQLALARLISFNRRRTGEVQAIK